MITKLTSDIQAMEFIKTKRAALILFGADWCRPCKAALLQLEPIIETMHQGGVAFDGAAYLDVDQCPRTEQQYAIKGIPCLLGFVNGELVLEQRTRINKTTLWEMARGLTAIPHG